jgi:hypothetical protein
MLSVDLRKERKDNENKIKKDKRNMKAKNEKEL